MSIFRLVKHVLCTISETFVMQGQKQQNRKLETIAVVLLMYRNCC